MTERAEPIPARPNVTARHRSIVLLGFVTLGVVTLLLAGAIVVAYLAYERQSDRVGALERRAERAERGGVRADEELARLRRELAESRRRLSAQAKELAAAEAEARRAYARGLAAGRAAGALPPKFAPLGRFAAQGFLVPGDLPPPLRDERVRITPGAHGYVVRWSRQALFASARDPISVWTRQAWPGFTSSRAIGARRVERLVGPAGIMYVWRERGRTYAVITYPQRSEERLARSIVASLR